MISQAIHFYTGNSKILEPLMFSEYFNPELRNVTELDYNYYTIYNLFEIHTMNQTTVWQTIYDFMHLTFILFWVTVSVIKAIVL